MFTFEHIFPFQSCFAHSICSVEERRKLRTRFGPGHLVVRVHIFLPSQKLYVKPNEKLWLITLPTTSLLPRIEVILSNHFTSYTSDSSDIDISDSMSMQRSNKKSILRTSATTGVYYLILCLTVFENPFSRSQLLRFTDNLGDNNGEHTAVLEHTDISEHTSGHKGASDPGSKSQ